MSWGHDEYLYHVVKDYLPEEALFIIRYHSFYPLHSSGAYTHLLSDKDRRMLSWLQRFQKFDLYSKSDRDLDMRTLMPFYEELVSEFLPDMLTW
jgi:inositol oxygenase